MMLKPLIDQLTEDIGMAPLHPEEDGSYVMKFEPALEIKVNENMAKGITLKANLEQATLESPEALHAALMEANLFGKETGGGCLGLDKEGKWIVFSSFVPEGANYREFRNTLEDFVNFALVWREDIRGFGKGGK